MMTKEEVQALMGAPQGITPEQGRQLGHDLLASIDQIESLTNQLIASKIKEKATDNKAICMYCGEVGERDIVPMLDHFKICPKHPNQLLEAAKKRLRQILEDIPGEGS